ncbi:MAG: CinA family nicotinamide mononucleotide deamidase-related protein [Pleurocapsa minor GSE-CHR-MK-17-07R]|jgi:nicotinamide-nucleotide amidase|nr:CinA family nicotinamide mononucleotide deamidase-related protein [Pleurocapsa minor GSE-CHR-MK 17-07R]
MRNVNAEIIAVGTEILLGEITDTNSVWLARQLRDLGINLYFMTSVGDNTGRIADAVRIALSRADLVIMCGGLGPTVDDMTRDGVALATDRPLEFQQHLLDSIAARFEGFRSRMTENNRRQAFVPQDALIVENPVGTAPSFIVEIADGDKVVLALPGVPREMKFLFSEKIIPYLREKFQLGGTVIRALVLKAAGIGESMLDDALGKDLLEGSNPTIGLAAHSGQVDIRITAKADTRDLADAMIATTETLVRQRVGEHIFGTNEDALEDAVLTLLRAQGLKLHIIETGVPPLVSGRLKAAVEAGDVTVVTRPSPEVLADGMRIRDAVEQAASQAAQPGTSVIAVTSTDASGEDHSDADELSALAVVLGESVVSRSYGFSGASDMARQFMGTWSLSMLWRLLKNNHA